MEATRQQLKQVDDDDQSYQHFSCLKSHYALSPRSLEDEEFQQPHYILKELLGQGAYSVVWSAY